MKCPECNKRLSLQVFTDPSFTVTTFKCKKCNSIYKAKFETALANTVTYLFWFIFVVSITYWSDKNLGISATFLVIISLMPIITFIGTEIVARFGSLEKKDEPDK